MNQHRNERRARVMPRPSGVQALSFRGWGIHLFQVSNYDRWLSISGMCFLEQDSPEVLIWRSAQQ